MSATIEVQRISKALSSIRGPQQYAVGGTWKPGLPCMEVEGVGDIFMPVSDHVARQLIFCANRWPPHGPSSTKKYYKTDGVWKLGTFCLDLNPLLKNLVFLRTIEPFPPPSAFKA